MSILATTALTRSVVVNRFMAFVAYNDEAGIKSRIDAQTVGIVKTGGFSYLPGSFYSGPTGLQRFMATGTVNGEKTLVLAFRGSSEGSDWAHNFQFIQAAWNYGTQTGTVHSGFKGQFDDKLSDWAALVKETIAAGNKKVIVAGHSLGGALSNLAAMYVAEAGFGHSSIDVITFGAPSAGNAGWQAHLAAKVANRAHVVNDADPVKCYRHLSSFRRCCNALSTDPFSEQPSAFRESTREHPHVHAHTNSHARLHALTHTNSRRCARTRTPTHTRTHAHMHMHTRTYAGSLHRLAHWAARELRPCSVRPTCCRRRCPVVVLADSEALVCICCWHSRNSAADVLHQGRRLQWDGPHGRCVRANSHPCLLRARQRL